jgi:asparagine synthetase B (glutamine-hydrolysing)
MTHNVRGALLDELSHIKAGNQTAGVLLSSGVDSNSVLFACLELGIEVTAYSFTLKGHESRDFKYARETAKVLGVKFVPIYLPTDVEHLKKYMKYAVRHGARSKTDFECFWPMRTLGYCGRQPLRTVEEGKHALQGQGRSLSHHCLP